MSSRQIFPRGPAITHRVQKIGKTGSLIIVSEKAEDLDSRTPIRPSVVNLLNAPSVKSLAVSVSTVATSTTETETDESSVISKVPRRGVVLENTHKESQTDLWLSDNLKHEQRLRRSNSNSSIFGRRVGPAPREVMSKLRLENIGDLNRVKLGYVIKTVVVSAFILMVSSFAFLILLLIVSVVLRPAEYLRNYFENHLGVMLWMYLGIFNPFFIGVYCFYCVAHLHSVRPYYWRVAIFLLVPFILLIMWIIILDHVDTYLELELREWFRVYNTSTTAHKIWDETQFGLCCCGVKKFEEWGSYQEHKKNATVYIGPHSCCANLEDCADGSHFWESGCLEKLKTYLHGIIALFIIIIFVQIVFQVVSMVAMKIFYDMISDLFRLQPTVMKIMVGPCSVLWECCMTSEGNFSNEFENDLLPRMRRGDLVFNESDTVETSSRLTRPSWNYGY